MKRAILIFAALTVAAFAILLFAKDNTYVGASACKLCHKAELRGRQYPIWSSSAHARSFTDLSSDEAVAVGKDMGVANPPESAQCLGCHAPLSVKAPELKAEGVTCEVCHGPGSGYRKLSIMEDKAKAVQNGLVLYPDAGAIQAHCLKCHQSAHGKTFDFEKAWDAIKHPIPDK